MPRYVDSKNNLQLENAIETKLSDSIDRVVMDFANVFTISSFAIGLIMRLRRTLMESGRFFYFINVSQQCLEQLETVNLDKVLPVLK